MSEVKEGVWIVELGEYSDRHVASVFPTKEEAEKYYGEGSATFYPFGVPEGQELSVALSVDWETGATEVYDTKLITKQIRSRQYKEEIKKVGKRYRYYTVVKGHDPVVAIKIANERRLRLKSSTTAADWVKTNEEIKMRERAARSARHRHQTKPVGGTLGEHMERSDMWTPDEIELSNRLVGE